MRNYNFKDKIGDLLTPEIVARLTTIHEYKGEQKLFIVAHPDALKELLDIAKIQSTAASNVIEGIYTSDERLKMIVQNKTMPRTRNEQEIAGYRDVLNTIHENYEFIPIRPSYLLQLHRDLYKFGQQTGGRFKSSDNVIAEEDENGNKRIRFKPVPSWETADSIEQLCNAYEEVIKDSNIDPLLVIPMFILDFLCIHPFDDGNGRMSRLLTLLLMYKFDYIVGKYISIEKLIETSKETYYEVLQQSSIGWHDEENDYEPFVNYLLGIIVAAYKDFSSRVNVVVTGELSKPDTIREIIKNHIGKITKTEIMDLCPNISQTTIQRTLIDLVDKKEIIKIGGGRYTSYVWNSEVER